MTRRTDVYPELYYRAVCKQPECEFILSIHTTRVTHDSGYDLYCPHQSGFTGKTSMIVQNELVKNLKGRNIGYHEPELVCLRKKKCRL